MTCSSCKNLDEKKKAPGAVSGAKYYCKELKCYVSGDTPKCAKHKRDILRSNDTCDKIFEEGRDYYNDDSSVGSKIIILVVIIIAFIIIRLLTL